MRTIIFDTATGQRVFRSALERVRAWTLPALRWTTEVAGVALVAVACWMVTPAAGLLVVGLYAIVFANTRD